MAVREVKNGILAKVINTIKVNKSFGKVSGHAFVLCSVVVVGDGGQIGLPCRLRPVILPFRSRNALLNSPGPGRSPLSQGRP